ncbi:MAG: hypothetical protein AAGL17_20485 [Cyanobacteria bacterium J06576_12]
MLLLLEGTQIPEIPEIIVDPVLRNNLITSIVVLFLISALRIGSTRIINEQM